MPKIIDIDPLDCAYFLMFVGESGSGKTGAAASFPKPKIEDFDNRVKGTLPMIRKNIYDKPEEMDYKTWAPPAGWAHISKYVDTLKMECITQREKYSGPLTYVFDSLTNMCKMLIEESLELQKGNIIPNPYDETTQTVGGKKADPSSKDYGRHSLRLSGPSDYKYEGEGIYQLLSTLRGLNSGIFGMKLNMIFTAHVIPLWGKPEDEKHKGEILQYADSVIVGKRISLRDKVQTNLLTVFDEVYYFEKDSKGKHFVQFNSEVARSVLVPNDIKKYDITDKNFYKFWQSKIAEAYPKKKEQTL